MRIGISALKGKRYGSGFLEEVKKYKKLPLETKKDEQQGGIGETGLSVQMGMLSHHDRDVKLPGGKIQGQYHQIKKSGGGYVFIRK